MLRLILKAIGACALFIATGVVLLELAFDSVAATPAQRQSSAQDRECVVYETRMILPPLIDWRCAEETAQMDGGDYYAKNFARALLAVRDHDYEERR